MKLRDWIDINKIKWRCLSKNPNAIHLLEQNPGEIDWYYLSLNPNAIHLLEQNPDKINWKWLSKNPNAIHLLEQNPDKIDWCCLSENPVIFTYNYTKLKQSHINLHKDFIEYFWHPSTIQKWIKKHCTAEDDGFDLYTYHHT